MNATELNAITRMTLVARKEGELNTPWDKCYKQSLIRECPLTGWEKTPYVLEHGVNYFVLKLESLKLKTLASCEGHPTGFYVLFKAPYKMARELAHASIGCSAEISISNTFKGKNLKNVRDIKEWDSNCWSLHLMPHGDSYECRNMLLRELSICWEHNL